MSKFSAFGHVSKAVLAEIVDCVRRVPPSQVDALAAELAKHNRVLLIGTGRSGLVLQAMATRLAHLQINTEFVASAEIQPGDLVLVGTGSGRTPAVLEFMEKAAAAGAKFAVITADPASPAAQKASLVIHIPSYVTPVDSSPHTLRSLFEECLLIVCDCICRIVQDVKGITTIDMQSHHSKRE